MKIAYFNCSSGVAGDMLISSLIDAGLPAAKLERYLRERLPIKGWKLQVTVVERGHHSARHMDVKGDRPVGTPAEMKRIIKGSKLPETVRSRSLAVLDTIIAAESRVHGVPKDKVHFHELNAIDTIIDVTGTFASLELLGIRAVYASPVNIGAPAPATLEILKEKGMPVYSSTAQYETATPTGIALLAHAADGFGAMPCLRLERSGYGAGTRQIPGEKNLLQVMVGDTPEEAAAPFERDEVVHLETNIDDMDPRVYPYVMERLLAAGARDTWLSQVIMKKGRPGIVLAVLCTKETEATMAEILFTETTTLGIRRMPCERHLLRRELREGEKIAFLPGGKERSKAEYEVARKKAIAARKPLSEFLR